MLPLGMGGDMLPTETCVGVGVACYPSEWVGDMLPTETCVCVGGACCPSEWVGTCYLQKRVCGCRCVCVCVCVCLRKWGASYTHECRGHVTFRNVWGGEVTLRNIGDMLPSETCVCVGGGSYPQERRGGMLPSETWGVGASYPQECRGHVTFRNVGGGSYPQERRGHVTFRNMCVCVGGGVPSGT